MRLQGGVQRRPRRHQPRQGARASARHCRVQCREATGPDVAHLPCCAAQRTVYYGGFAGHQRPEQGARAIGLSARHRSCFKGVHPKIIQKRECRKRGCGGRGHRSSTRGGLSPALYRRCSSMPPSLPLPAGAVSRATHPTYCKSCNSTTVCQSTEPMSWLAVACRLPPGSQAGSLLGSWTTRPFHHIAHPAQQPWNTAQDYSFHKHLGSAAQQWQSRQGGFGATAAAATTAHRSKCNATKWVWGW